MLARRPEVLNHTLFLVDFIIIMSGSRFSVHTADSSSRYATFNFRDLAILHRCIARGLFTHTSDMVHWAQRADGK